MKFVDQFSPFPSFLIQSRVTSNSIPSATISPIFVRVLSYPVAGSNGLSTTKLFVVLWYIEKSTLTLLSKKLPSKPNSISSKVSGFKSGFPKKELVEFVTTSTPSSVLNACVFKLSVVATGYPERKFAEVPIPALSFKKLINSLSWIASIALEGRNEILADG